MTKAKLILVGYHVLSDKIVEDFYLKEAQESGFDVEYWDLRVLYFDEKVDDEKLKYNIKTNFIQSYKDLAEKLKVYQNEKVLYILNFTFSYKLLKLFKLITKYECQIGVFARGAIPQINSECYGRIHRLANLIKNPKRIIKHVKNLYAKIYKELGFIKDFDIVFQAGEKGLNTIGILSERQIKRIIQVNYFDYDRYKTSDNRKLIKNNYCVFHDEFLPHHPDFKMDKIKTVESDAYYDNLHEFFKKVEQKYNVEVVIAAHPKAKYYRNKNYFKGRKVFFGEIENLIRFSEFSILHASTSVSYSILSKKNCLFISTYEIREKMVTYDKWIQSFAKEIGQRFQYIDNSDVREMKCISEIDYNNYIKKYLTTNDSEFIQSSKIFINFLLDEF